MKQILFILFISIFLSSCVQLSYADSTDFAGIKKGDKYWIVGVCRGPEAGEVYAQSVEKAQHASPELVKLLRKGTCIRTPVKVVIHVEKVVRALIDWEDDEAYLVQLSHTETSEPIDFYSIVWPQITNFEEPSNGSHDGPYNRSFSGPQWDISSHLTPVQAGERVWIGGMCRAEEGAAIVLFLSAQTGSMEDIQSHVKAGRCRSLGNMQRVLIAAVLTDGIDVQGDTYWLIQLANNKAEPQPWYSLAWECTLEANLNLSNGDCR